MNLKEISELIKLVDKSNLAEVEIKLEGLQVKIRHEKYFKNTGSPSVMQVPAVVQTPVAPQQPPVTHHISAHSAPAQTSETSAEESKPKSNLLEIKSPMVGTFYRSAGPDKPAFVQVGDAVQKGTSVCIIEAMKLFNEIESEVSGKIVKVLVEDASPVEYDQVLFLVEA